MAGFGRSPGGPGGDGDRVKRARRRSAGSSRLLATTPCRGERLRSWASRTRLVLRMTCRRSKLSRFWRCRRRSSFALTARSSGSGRARSTPKSSPPSPRNCWRMTGLRSEPTRPLFECICCSREEVDKEAPDGRSPARTNPVGLLRPATRISGDRIAKEERARASTPLCRLGQGIR